MDTKQTKLERAMALYDSGTNAHAAAVQAELPPQHLYVALKKRKDADMKAKGICPCCGASLKAPKDMADLELTVARVLQALDYTAKNSEGIEKREICADIARRLRGG